MIKIRNRYAGNWYGYKYMNGMNIGNPVCSTKGKIVGVNLKKTFVTEPPNDGQQPNVFYGLFVHIKIENGDQYTFIFDPFSDYPGIKGASKLTGNSEINTTHRVSWKRIKKVYRCFKETAKRMIKSGKSPEDRFIRFSYMPTILRLMEICGANEAVDIIGKEVIISTLNPLVLEEHYVDTLGPFFGPYVSSLTMFMASLGEDDTIDVKKGCICPIMYYVDTNSEIINAFIDKFISKYPSKLVPAYGHEVEE